ncbi:hypothetical protein AFLA_000830 [Aspergillus flavus NRRL3357]|nr:hypothetical protein AFLA_000830 [Aspergillus flavus NRRL3357]
MYRAEICRSSLDNLTEADFHISRALSHLARDLIGKLGWDRDSSLNAGIFKFGIIGLESCSAESQSEPKY